VLLTELKGIEGIVLMINGIVIFAAIITFFYCLFNGLFKIRKSHKPGYNPKPPDKRPPSKPIPAPPEPVRRK